MELRKGLREIMMVNMMKVAAIEKRTIYHLFRKHDYCETDHQLQDGDSQ